jgi:hypothetical protein
MSATIRDDLMLHVLGVSMPRSGHHLFEMILKNTLGRQFSYCEFYEQGCCKTIPCQSQERLGAAGIKIFMQKSHDFGFKDPVDVPGTQRVIQYRSPIPRALSNYELHLKNGFEDTVPNFRNFLVAEALYFERFYKKWVADRREDFFLLSYEELTGDPVKGTLNFFEYLKMPLDLDRITNGVAKSVGMRGRDNTSFVRADVYAHRYANLPVMGNFEDMVLRDCPGYFPTRYYAPTDSPKSIIGMLYGARKAINEGDRATAIALAEAAGRQVPDDPVLKRFLNVALRLGERGGAARPTREQRGSVEGVSQRE